jgi:hypothetical protein
VDDAAAMTFSAVVEGRIDGRERHAPSLTIPAEVVTTAG